MPRISTAFTREEKYTCDTLTKESIRNLRAVAHDMGVCAGAKKKDELVFDIITDNKKSRKYKPSCRGPSIKLSSRSNEKRKEAGRNRIRNALKTLASNSESGEINPGQLAIADHQHLRPLFVSGPISYPYAGVLASSHISTTQYTKRKYDDGARQPDCKRPRISLAPVIYHPSKPFNSMSDEPPSTLVTIEDWDSISRRPSSSPTGDSEPADSPWRRLPTQNFENTGQRQLPPIRQVLHFVKWTEPEVPLACSPMAQDRPEYILYG